MANEGGKVALAILVIVFFIGWTIFGYTVLIAAFLNTTGLLQLALGVYIVGSLLVVVFSQVVKNAIK